MVFEGLDIGCFLDFLDNKTPSVYELFTESITRNPEKLGFVVSRWGFGRGPGLSKFGAAVFRGAGIWV